MKAAGYFDSHNQKINDTQLYQELTLFVAPSNQVQFNGITDIDSFYVAVDQTEKSPKLFKLFRLVSTVSISNAEVERKFSRSKLVITKHMSNLQEENFNARKKIISGMKFFGDDIATFAISTSLVRKVSLASSNYKRKLEARKTENETERKWLHLDEEVTEQIRLAKEVDNLQDKEIEHAISEAGKLEKDIKAEQRTLTEFLNCMAKCKDGARIQELVKQSTVSTATMADMQEELKMIRTKILELQVKKFSRK